jgi:hypothetical protein
MGGVTFLDSKSVWKEHGKTIERRWKEVGKKVERKWDHLSEGSLIFMILLLISPS